MKPKLSRRSFLQHSAVGLGAIGSLSTRSGGRRDYAQTSPWKNRARCFHPLVWRRVEFREEQGRRLAADDRKGDPGRNQLFLTRRPATNSAMQHARHVLETVFLPPARSCSGRSCPSTANRSFSRRRSKSVASAEGMKEFETSMKLLKADYLDILLIHSIEASRTSRPSKKACTRN